MNKPVPFKKKLIAAAVTSCALTSTAGPVAAQSSGGDGEKAQTEMLEEVTVLGVRGAQQTAVNIKRTSASIVDAISAEDIGKLPDVTVADSLQRIAGVQIQRNAGEGATANIRGLPQVVTLLNGEQYLSPGNLAGAQPTLTDIPAQLMRGIDVYKSTDLTNALSGISGTIDLKTRRPFQMDEGYTLAGGAEVSSGEYSSETDPSVNGLFNWRDDKMGFLVAGSYSNVNLGNNYSGVAQGGFDGLSGNNDWGGSNPVNFISPHGYESLSRVVERERQGVNAVFQMDLGSGFEFVAEGFYTEMEEYDRGVGIKIANRWSGEAFGNWVQPTVSHDTGVNAWQNVDEYDVDAWWVHSLSSNRVTESSSKNLNLELNYDNGGNLTGSVRAITASAENLVLNGRVEGDLSNWEYAPGRYTLFRNQLGTASDPFFNQGDIQLSNFYPADIAAQFSPDRYTNDTVGSAGGRYVHPNPLGYGENPRLHYNIGAGTPTWSGFDQPISGGLGPGATLRDYMANVDSYAVGAFSSEGNGLNEADLDVFRLDGNYKFDQAVGGFVTSVDIGLRKSSRAVSIQAFHNFSPFYVGSTGANGQINADGCQAQWKAIDVVMNQDQCQAGEMVPHPLAGQTYTDANGDTQVYPDTVFQGYTVNPPTALNQYNDVIWVDDFGSGTKGMPGVWAIDPRDFDDPEAFHRRVFGAANRTTIPGRTYDVDLDETSYYVSANFDYGIISGNLGVKVIETELLVKQNLTGPTLNYGDTNIDTGDEVTRVNYTDVLPALNMSIDPTDNLRFRVAASQTMTPLDLDNYGGGLAISTADDPDLGIRIVTGANASGNPHLNPWRANNYDLAAEYYIGSASMVNMALFYVDIESFVTTDTIDGQFPDQDGVIRRTVQVTLPVQGKSGVIKGVEMGGKFAFSDITDGFLSNFGVDSNYTYSPSKMPGKALSGDDLPFEDNSKHQFNLIGWYQDEKLQARVAYNYRSDRLAGGTTQDLQVYQDETSYVEINVSYDIVDGTTVYLQGSNVTGEVEKYSVEFREGERQFAWQNEFEPRYTLGIRSQF